MFGSVGLQKVDKHAVYNYKLHQPELVDGYLLIAVSIGEKLDSNVYLGHTA